MEFTNNLAIKAKNSADRVKKMSMWPLLTVDAESKDEEGNTLLDLDTDHLGCLLKK
jgi:hypothetical protein